MNINSSDDLKKAQRKAMALKSLDLSWPIENAMIDLITGDSAERYAEQRLIKCLPSKERNYTLSEATTRFEKEVIGPLTKLSPHSVQTTQNTVLKWLKQLHAGRTLDVGALNTTRMAHALLTQLQYFVRAKSGEEMVYGTKALEVLGKVAEEKHKAEQLEANGMADLTTFRWLMPAGLLEPYKAWKH